MRKWLSSTRRRNQRSISRPTSTTTWRPCLASRAPRSTGTRRPHRPCCRRVQIATEPRAVHLVRTCENGHLADAGMSAGVRFAPRLFAEDHLVNQTPIGFDNLRVCGGQSTCNLHFRPEFRERGGKAYHHIMEWNGIDGGKETLFLNLN